MEDTKMKKAINFKELTPDMLAWTLDAKKIPFDSSDDCKACEGIIGQERALKAIQTGLDIPSLGYNIFVTGMVGTGRTTTIKQLLEKMQKEEEKPDDILYVNNFKHPDEPTLIILPSGQGNHFKEAMSYLIEMLKSNIPELLKSKYYTEKRDKIVESAQKTQKETLNVCQTGSHPNDQGETHSLQPAGRHGQGRKIPEGKIGGTPEEIRRIDRQTGKDPRNTQGV
jgi:ATP-dependent Lon protease